MIEHEKGQVVASHGRHFVARTEAGSRLACVARGKNGSPAVGDWITVETVARGQGRITEIGPRTSLLYRSDAYRRKLLAANLTQLCVVVATEPSFSDELLGRALIAAEALLIPAVIVLNKIDLTRSRVHARARLDGYEALGYPIEEISVKEAPETCRAQLLPRLARHTTLFLGQSGMGKSSLLNLLVPDAQAATREISEALQTGKHTTTDARLYDLPEGSGKIIDTPGFQEFGLAHLSPGEIERAFPELRPYLGQCRFYNCSHLIEPGCAIRHALEMRAIPAARYALFSALTRESAATTR